MGGSFTIQGCCPHLVKEKKNMYCSMHQTCVQLAAFAVVLCIRARTVTLTKAFSTAYHCQCFQISSRADWNENQGHGFSIASNVNCCKCSPPILFCTGLSFKCHGKANTGLQIGGKRIHRKSRSFENAQGKYTARRPEQKCI